MAKKLKFKVGDRVTHKTSPNKGTGTIVKAYENKPPWSGAPYYVRFRYCSSYFAEEELKLEKAG